MSNADGGNEIALDKMDGSLALNMLLELKYQRRRMEEP